MEHVTIDLETLGTRPTSAILAIGAVTFNRETEDTAEFYYNVDLGSCLACDLTVDANTFYWWLQQEDAARKALIKDCYPLPQVLHNLNGFMDLHNCKQIWTHATFDAPILANAYSMAMVEPTWNYFNHRDIRTLEELKPWIEMKRKGVHHNALDDARYQAAYIRTLLNSRS